jgi:hypothetical protein
MEKENRPYYKKLAIQKSYELIFTKHAQNAIFIIFRLFFYKIVHKSSRHIPV